MRVVEAPLAFDVPKMEKDLTGHEGLGEEEAAILPRYNNTNLPRNPPARVPLNDASDGYDRVDQIMGHVSDYVMNPPDGLPVFFFGETCSLACMDCGLGASRMGCECFATCLKGGEGNCVADSHGWSNEQKTMPSQFWEAQCNSGQTRCSECMDKAMVAEITACADNQKCLHQVRRRYSPSETMQQAVYCYRQIVPGGKRSQCETFLKPPPEVTGFKCFSSPPECNGKKEEPQYEDVLPSVAAPSIWENTPLVK